MRNIADQVSDLLGRLDDLEIRRPVGFCRDLAVLDYPPGVDGNCVRGVRGWLSNDETRLIIKQEKIGSRCTAGH